MILFYIDHLSIWSVSCFCKLYSTISYYLQTSIDSMRHLIVGLIICQIALAIIYNFNNSFIDSLSCYNLYMVMSDFLLFQFVSSVIVIVYILYTSLFLCNYEVTYWSYTSNCYCASICTCLSSCWTRISHIYREVYGAGSRCCYVNIV